MKTIIANTIRFIFIISILYACTNKQVKTEEIPIDSAVIKDTSINIILKQIEKNKKHIHLPTDALVTEIVISSTRYKQLTKGLNKTVVKNGGLYFGLNLEASPNCRQDTTCIYSRTYDFIIFEMYRDRQLNTVRFSFDPKSNQLYEYDVVSGNMKPIEYNKNLLLNSGTNFK